MRIAFDISPLSHPRRTGIPAYVRGSLLGLAAAAGHEDEVVPFAPVSLRGADHLRAALNGSPLEPKIARVPPAPLWRTLWSRLGWPPAERLLGPFDALHFSDWMYPPQGAGVRATTIHDLVPLRFPQWTTRGTRWMHAAKYRETARSCDVVFVNSTFTGRDVVDLLGVEEGRIRLASPGVDPVFRPDGEPASLERPYVLTVATLEPRKNLETLLAARRLIDPDLLLAIAGSAGWGQQPELDRPGVVRLGFTATAELARLYRGAEALVLPSRFEGFGMPAIEAMASGTPAVVSSHPSLDDASGDAAVRVDPESPEAIAAGIEDARARRGELVERGLRHARRFTWEAAGREMLDGYRAFAP